MIISFSNNNTIFHLKYFLHIIPVISMYEYANMNIYTAFIIPFNRKEKTVFKTKIRNKAVNDHTDLPASHHHSVWNVEAPHN